jgi:hypothetical protein
MQQGNLPMMQMSGGMGMQSECLIILRLFKPFQSYLISFEAFYGKLMLANFSGVTIMKYLSKFSGIRKNP